MTLLKEIDNTEFGLLKLKDYIKFYYFNRALIIGMRSPSREEIKSYKSGDLSFKLYTLPNVIFLIFKIGNLDWCDLAYSVHLDLIKNNVNYEEKLLKSYPKEFRLVLFDVFTGKIKVIRKFAFSQEFTVTLRDKIFSQYQGPFNLDDYNAEVNSIYSNYFSSHLALNNKNSSFCLISGENVKEIKELLYDRCGYGTNKSIPKWIYREIHHPKIYGLITKEQIPENVLQSGVVKVTYKKVKNKYWTVELFKNKNIKRKRS